MRKFLTVLLALCTVFTVAFIFYHSLQNGEQSSAASGTVSDVVADVVVPDLPTRPETEQNSIMEKIQKWVRTFAHAIEFAALGFFFCAFFLVFSLAEKIPFPFKLLSAFLFCASTALIDETVQIFVEARAFELRDIGVDMLGATVGILAAFGIYRIYSYAKRKQSETAPL